MEIKVLIDNISSSCPSLLVEHGLSIYFEIDGYKWLMDLGASSKYSQNAREMGIDISDIDYVILSHAHRDHTGGLSDFLTRNIKAKIYLSSSIQGNYYFSTRRGLKRDISIDHTLFEKNSHRFIPIISNLKISSNVSIISNIPHPYPEPIANKTLLVNNKPDSFEHEVFLSITTTKGIVILSACSHHGILNTLSANGSHNILAYIGGTHLLDSKEDKEYEKEENLKEIAHQIKSLYPSLHLISGHCTGKDAQRVFSEILKDKFSLFYSGFIRQI